MVPWLQLSSLLSAVVIVLKDFLDPSTIAHMNSVIDTIDSQQPFDSTMSANPPSAAKGGQAVSRKDRFSFLETDPVFLEVMAHPRLLEIIREMCGGEEHMSSVGLHLSATSMGQVLRYSIACPCNPADWLRLDHAYGIAMDQHWAGRQNLHGGARTDQGE